MNEKSIDLGQCILDCNGEKSCEESCVSLFKYQYDQCPCQVYMETSFSYGPDGLGSRLWVYRLDPTLLYFQDDCPFGCPCDSFDCQPDKKSVLVLNTFTSSQTPVLIKYDGRFDLKVRYDLL